MPPRLAHKKSRRGCQRCKTRKVKCDEIRPTCAACHRHNITCVYSNASEKATTSRELLTPGSTPSQDASAVTPSNRIPGPASPYDLDSTDSFEPEERRVMELRLLHHFLTVVAYTFPASYTENIRDIWLADSVRFGFKHSFMLNAIFAISALHAAVYPEKTPKQDAPPPSWTFFMAHANTVVAPTSGSHPQQGEIALDFAKAHRIYLNKAVQEQRQALSDLSSSNADAVCLTSILLSIISQKLIPTYPQPEQIYDPPTQWLIMSQAIATVIQATTPLLTDGAVIKAIIALNDPDFRDTSAIFNPKFLEPFRRILDFQPDPDPETQDTYRQALMYVGSVYDALARRDPPRQLCRRFMSFGPMVPRHFVVLLEERRPRALVILAHLMAMAKYVEEFWWFRGAAERDVRGVQSLLPEEWAWAMQWPVDVLRDLSLGLQREKVGM